jgi:hypothetical protein
MAAYLGAQPQWPTRGRAPAGRRERLAQRLRCRHHARAEPTQGLILERDEPPVAHGRQAAESPPFSKPTRPLARRRGRHDDVGVAGDHRLGINYRAQLPQVAEHIPRTAERERVAHQVTAANGIDGPIPDLQQHGWMMPISPTVLASNARQLLLQRIRRLLRDGWIGTESTQPA